MKDLKFKSYRDFNKGTWQGVQSSKVPINSVRLALNYDSDVEYGSMVSRPGTTLIGSQIIAGKDVLGLHNYRDSLSSNSKLFAVVSDGINTDIYDVLTGDKSLEDDTSPISRSVSPSLSQSVSPSPSRSASISPSISQSISPSESYSSSISKSISSSFSPSGSVSPSKSPSKSASISPSTSPSLSNSLSSSQSASLSPSVSPPNSYSASKSPSLSPSISPSLSPGANAELYNTNYFSDPHLKAYYRFESLLDDDSGNGNTLTNSGGVTQTTGIFGQSAAIRSGQYLEKTSVFGLTNHNWSVSVWAKSNSNNQVGLLLNIGSSNGFGIYQNNNVDSTPGNYIGMLCGGVDYVNFSKLWPDHTNFHHIVITRNTITMSLYVDGILVGTNVSIVPTNPTTKTIIGSGNGSFDIDDVSIFDRVLSADEVAELYGGVPFLSVSPSVSPSEGSKIGLKTRFLTYLNSCLRLNGVNIPKAFENGSWITRGGVFDLKNIPSGSKYCLEFKDRVYIAGNPYNPDRVDISGIADSNTRQVSWTSGNKFFLAEQEDGGGGITGLAKVPGYVLIFKKRTMKRYDGSSAYPEDMVNQGAPSQETIVTAQGMCFFVNENGAWATTGGSPKKISSFMVDDIIKSCSDEYLVDVASGTDEEHIYWSFKSVTILGETVANVVLKYNIAQQTWDVRKYATFQTVFTKYVDSTGSVFTTFGDNNGNVQKLDIGTTDNGTPIYLSFEPQDLDFGYRCYQKGINRMIWLTENISKGTLMWRNSHNPEDWEELGTIKNEVEDINGINIRGNFFDFKLIESVDSGQAKILGFEFPDLSVKIYENS